ncbi:hypothetical protein [Neobacillus sp. D3-1R]|uniref:hypothetical protein n=1 Tax=Neobacillus sp. D3-1R TaxID=3445778 RepID=UPI003FA079A9
MRTNLKEEMSKIEIPNELHNRVVLGVTRAKLEKRPNVLFTRKRIFAAAAVVIILGSSITLGSSQIAGAVESFITRIFGSEQELKQSFPNASGEDLNQFEKHLELASANLTAEEFRDYSQLQKEAAKLVKKMTVTENGQVIQKPEELTASEQNRLDEISQQLQKYEARLDAITTHTVEEAQKMVDYPINKPAFVPEGYQLINSTAHSDEEQPGKKPIVVFEYQKGEFGFRTFQQSLDQEDDLDRRSFEHSDSYLLKGYKMDFHYSDGTNVQGMRLMSENQNFKIVIVADILSKEEMEKILLSMVSE